MTAPLTESAVPYPRLCAHCGLTSTLPENSLPAYAAAIAAGADEIELARQYVAMGVDTLVTNRYFILRQALRHGLTEGCKKNKNILPQSVHNFCRTSCFFVESCV